MSFQLRIKHNGIEIEFSSQDLQQAAVPAAPVIRALPKPVKAAAKRRGRPPGQKNKPKVIAVPQAA